MAIFESLSSRLADDAVLRMIPRANAVLNAGSNAGSNATDSIGLIGQGVRWVRNHQVITVLLLLAAVKGLLWTAATPPWRAPDEPQHFGYIQFLSREHSLPFADSIYMYPDVMSSMARTNFGGIWGQEATSVDFETQQINPAAGHPPLYYLLMLPAYRLARGGSVETQLYAVRVWATSIFLLMILVAWRLARISFPRAVYMQIAVLMLLIFHPQLGFIFGCVNNDSLLALLFTIWLLEIVLVAQGDLSSRRAALLGTVTGLGMLTKSAFIISYPLMLIVFIAMLIRRSDRLKIIRAGGIILGISLVVCGWYYLRAQLHQSVPMSDMRVERYGQIGWLSLVFDSQFTSDLFDSFLGNFSWLSVPLLANVMVWFRRLVWLAGLGVLATLGLSWRHRREMVITPWLAGLYAAVFATAFVFTSIFELKLGAAQGRYLFLAVFPFWSLFLVGLTGLVPAGWRPRIVGLIVLVAASFSSWALIHEFLPRVT